MKDDQYFMKLAIEQAQKAEDWQEVPVGAVLVKEGELIAAECNQNIRLHDPTAHAEILVLRAAAQKLQNYRLVDTTIYVTLEPCAMCAGAMVHARIKRLVYGAADLRTGAVSSVYSITQDQRLNHQIECEGGVLEEECRLKIQSFFQQRRQQLSGKDS